jgi:CRISPR-associated protein Csb2
VGTTLAIRFPLGRYHANPWDRAVNEGASEWPPSPWRILRALLATWYTRWPDLPESVIDKLLDALADPPAYRTPPVRSGHTRHYLPDLDHRKGETGHTDLTLDPFLTVDRDAELLVRWDVDLVGEQREVLAKLAELLPYLGRSESVCEARLVDGDLVPDETWWRPEAESGARRCRLLTVTRPLNRSTVEVTTSELRKRRRTLPPGIRWLTYTASEMTPPSDAAVSKGSGSLVTAIRFAVTGSAPLETRYGVLLADEAHRRVGSLLEKATIPDCHRRDIMGTGRAASCHRHAHWIPLPDLGTRETGRIVRSLVIWVPNGLQTDDVRAILGLRSVSGQRGGIDGYQIRGFPQLRLLFQAAGSVQDVAPELSRPLARRWRSVTPYLPVRYCHPKRETIEEFLMADVTAELRYRDLPDVVSVTPVEPSAGRVNQFRRYRMNERLTRSREGVGLGLEFESPVAGPLLLGQLSHFGFGMFQPEPL